MHKDEGPNYYGKKNTLYGKYGVPGDPGNKNKKKFERHNKLAAVAKKRREKADLTSARRTINMFPIPKKK